MIFWLDAHLSPEIIQFIETTFGDECHHVIELGDMTISDKEIYKRLQKPGNVVITKDKDFRDLQERLSAPPQIIWLRMGNTSNTRLKEVLTSSFEQTKELLSSGESIVEIVDRKSSTG